MPIHLILGGARSGKSAYAEKLAIATAQPVTYIATAQIYDAEFGNRVAHHKARRPSDWRTIEQPFNLGATLLNTAKPDPCIIIDCLTLWLAQCICPDCERPPTFDWPTERQALLDALAKLAGTVIIVSNEVGMGIVPLGEINRQFQDEQGRLNQAVAQLADQVTFIAAGLPLKLKG
ncbi:MAG TPA: bifunctional adenosylcobinamide kinase/adenosylcobinamide-phosphate guanylyltransferase [Methylotenera sp.]|nr:bifunctional adenosylcobinamide kinase/adenosylcobinamide-phosphate guanylyltransferase [Methylotenera sp.]HPH05594.1 bifunctional adenosylcobinamide kinase/adenosylcobinamide-phosphate guanylyltransferase [Methylotenera sp.]HPM99991.1 bifunctional adenosylcobinamide kinase/adenosylcobinamide-phosphate guanylyltransferase [Methylotenera sp.]